ncbi:putative glycine-rich cell wall structural protein 1 [Daphnia pulicaria]|uniref:putative glycine-rich cell wall structural protein 1 n=1 Tax=Daphnia pulicaria TaxID=35523 RepID=UPI001EEABC3B|nr:putative glycine-rich cell wall structural protein 1 [Daphnia pulicaria]
MYKVTFILALIVAVAVAMPQRPFRPRPGGFQQPGFGGFGGFNNFGGSGTGAGAGTGSAGPQGVSASGVAISSAQNGGFGTASGSGTGFLGPFGQAGATGQGTGSSFGK